MADLGITSFTKIEPDPIGNDLLPTLEGRVYDPAWMLARQWQTGEFSGEDAGSPIHVSVDVQGETISGFYPGGGEPLPAGGLPVSFLAGAEPREGRLPIESAEAGAELLNLLREYGCSRDFIDRLPALYPFALNESTNADSGALAFFSILAPAAGALTGLPDPFSAGNGGWSLEELLRSTLAGGGPDPRLGAPACDAFAVVKAAGAWVTWIDSLYPENTHNYSWKDENLEHSFALEAKKSNSDKKTTFTGKSWNGKSLDWYNMDVSSGGGPEPKKAITARKLHGLTPELTAHHSGLPMPLNYAGMPSARWWEFEDSSVNFMQVSCEEDDLARLLVVEFAMANGNDWYLVPMRLPVGALYNVSDFSVTDTFGITKPIRPVSDGKDLDWALFRLSHAENRSDLHDGLLLFPSVYTQESAPVEQIQFFRDEMANVAWAAELCTEGADGAPYDRQRQHKRKAAKTEGEKEQELKESYEYELVSYVPANWFPFVPSLSRKYQMLLMDPEIKPAGRILRGYESAGGAAAQGASRYLACWEGEIPREGSEVTRRYIMSRDADGKVLLWRGRQKRAGRGEGDSGLRYDSAK